MGMSEEFAFNDMNVSEDILPKPDGSTSKSLPARSAASEFSTAVLYQYRGKQVKFFVAKQPHTMDDS